MSESKLTAWERWELSTFEGGRPAPKAQQPVPKDEPPALPTAEQIEAMYQQARDEGRAAGHAEGYAAGQAEGQAAINAEAQRLAEAISRLDMLAAELDEKLSGEILDLALDIARAVTCQQTLNVPDTILGVVREALLLLPHHHAMVYLHPDDAALVRTQMGETLSHAGHRIHEDTSLSRGDCRLEAGNTHIDATLNTRWRQVVAALGNEAPLDPDQRNES